MIATGHTPHCCYVLSKSTDDNTVRVCTNITKPNTDHDFHYHSNGPTRKIETTVILEDKFITKRGNYLILGNKNSKYLVTMVDKNISNFLTTMVDTSSDINKQNYYSSYCTSTNMHTSTGSIISCNCTQMIFPTTTTLSPALPSTKPFWSPLKY